jgi:cell wall-associated NlpC family hydrolase
MTKLDKRLHAFRDDLADDSLRGSVGAQDFVSGILMQCADPVAGVHRSASPEAMQLTQVLWGETVTVFERKNGWAWVQLQRDGYVGYMEETGLATSTTPASHRLLVRSSHLYPAANLKSQPAIAIPMGSELAVAEAAGDFNKLTSGHFVYAAHLNQSPPVDFVSVAEQFLHTPYLWGGKTVWGLDCSGLVQVSLQATGASCLRDSDMQEQSLGIAIGLDNLRRGDLVFWKGHVGIMQDATTLLHANGHHMMVLSEPLKVAVERIAAKGSTITSVKRLQ